MPDDSERSLKELLGDEVEELALWELIEREQLEGETRNTSKLPEPALVDTLEFLAEEMEESLGVKLEFPLDQPGIAVPP